VTELRQLYGKVIEHVRSVPGTGHQDEHAARSSPIEHLDLHTIAHGHKLHSVRRWILPLRRLSA
jgi:hypothetical protein